MRRPKFSTQLCVLVADVMPGCASDASVTAQAQRQAQGPDLHIADSVNMAAKAACDLHDVLMQTIHDGFQHEQPDYWLNFGNPWEIERLNIAYTIKFYGHVSVQEEGGRQTFRWNPGESVSSCRLAYANDCVCQCFDFQA